MTNHVNCQDESIVEVQVEVKVTRMEKGRRRERDTMIHLLSFFPSLYLSVISCNIQMHSNQELGWSPSSFPDVLDGLVSLFFESPHLWSRYSLSPFNYSSISLFPPSFTIQDVVVIVLFVYLFQVLWLHAKDIHELFSPISSALLESTLDRERTRERTKSNSVELSKGRVSEIERRWKENEVI